MNIVEIQDVTKRYGATTAVANLSLTVPQGSIYGFIGPNGSGKTTTLRMITSIIYPDSGLIRVFSEVSRGACSDRIGYLPEERGLYRRMKVREILRFFGELKNGKNVQSEVERWIKKLELEEHAHKKVEALSKGTSQKVQFVAAVVFQPELVILDEPFSGLDPVNAEIMKGAILELKKQGTTVILSTHDMSIAEKMCDYIFMIFKGSKVLDGTLASIHDLYATDIIRIRSDVGMGALDGLPGVESINDSGQVKELRMARNCDPQEVLSVLLSRARLQSFEIVKPSLHDIFVRIARPQEKEANHA